MENDFFADIRQEDSDPFESINQGDEPEASQAENTQEETAPESVPTEDKPVPYHKDPRWIKNRQDMESERQARLAAEQELNELKRLLEETSESVVDQPAFLTDMVGEDETVARNFKAYETELRQKIVQDLRNQQIEEEQRAQRVYDENVRIITENLDSVSETYNVRMRDSSGEFTAQGKELLEFMDKYPLTNEYGVLDMHKGFELLQEVKSQKQAEAQYKSQVRKDIASNTISRDNSNKADKDYLTQNELRGKSWYNL